MNVRKVIRSVLLYGVTAGVAFVVAGLVLSFVIEWTFSCSMSYIISVAQLNFSLLKFTSMIDVTRDFPLALMSIGITILIFVPVVRAMLTVLMFIVDDDKLYAFLCALVVLIVLLSFLVVGPIMHGFGR
ncbi:MAG: DUF1634 domain-containing protein [Thermoplasmata archaeon]